jgi:hypothetical protein
MLPVNMLRGQVGGPQNTPMLNGKREKEQDSGPPLDKSNLSEANHPFLPMPISRRTSTPPPKTRARKRDRA